MSDEREFRIIWRGENWGAPDDYPELHVSIVTASGSVHFRSQREHVFAWECVAGLDRGMSFLCGYRGDQ